MAHFCKGRCSSCLSPSPDVGRGVDQRKQVCRLCRTPSMQAGNLQALLLLRQQMLGVAKVAQALWSVLPEGEDLLALSCAHHDLAMVRVRQQANHYDACCSRSRRLPLRSGSNACTYGVKNRVEVPWPLCSHCITALTHNLRHDSRTHWMCVCHVRCMRVSCAVHAMHMAIWG